MLVLRQRLATEEARVDAARLKMFRVTALRNRQVGLWAALMMEWEDVEDYADEIVALGLQRGGELAIVDKLIEDFGQAEMDVSPEVICLEMAQRTLSAERNLSRSPDLLRAA